MNRIEIKKINTQAKSDLLKKLKLERTFEPEIKSLFSQMHNDFRISVAATGQAPSAEDYSSAWEVLLRKHYKRTQDAFLGVVNLEKKDASYYIEHKLFEQLLALALLNYRKLRAVTQSMYITRTNAKNMTDSTSEARASLTEQELPVDNESLSKTATNILKRKTKGRVESIKTLETQNPAENTKIMEARTQAGDSPTDTKPSEVKKTWRTLGDSKVRASHKTANFQTVTLDESFVVGESLLNFPGDNSLGAPVSQTINCRCAAVYRR